MTVLNGVLFPIEHFGKAGLISEPEPKSKGCCQLKHYQVTQAVGSMTSSWSQNETKTACIVVENLDMILSAEIKNWFRAKKQP
jgi:hypothetical protein